ncbi:MAG: hypothetical protein KGI38_08060 [Thaumarchaeota archaeon]|nr:hypothetical protein [Nitrososphaerota archaeon]
MISPQIEGTQVSEIGQGVTFGKNSRVVGRDVSIGSGTTFGDDVQIRADVVRIGRMCKIETNLEASWRGGNAKLFVMGDCSSIGSDSRVLVKEFLAGDYVVLHNHLLANGDGLLKLGNNAWVGQNGILNANQPLSIGNNVGIGAYSAVWTHGKFGALIDGCLMHKEAPVAIEDDACIWRAVVSPGVKIGRRATVLPNSVVTKDAPAGSCFGGVPAIDLSEKVKTYRKVSVKEQFQMMKEFVSEFLAKEYAGEFTERGKGEYWVGDGRRDAFRFLLKWEVEDGDFAEDERAIAVAVKDSTSRVARGVSLFDLTARTYTKRFTDPEIKFMWFMNDSRARFNPREAKAS